MINNQNKNINIGTTSNIEIVPLGKDIKPKKDKVSDNWFLRLLKGIFDIIIFALASISFGLILGKSFLIDNNSYCAWLAIFLFIVVLNNIKDSLTSCLYSWLSGIIFYIVALYWIYPTVLEGTGQQELAMVSVIGLAIILGLQYAIFGYAYYYIKQLKWAIPFGAGALWVSCELLHQLIAYNIYAFPWVVLGYSQFEHLPLIQISSLTGAYGVSFLIVFVGASASMLIGNFKKTQKFMYFILPILLLAMVYISGKQDIRKQLEYVLTSPKKISTALMQTNSHKLFLDGRYDDIYYVVANQLLSLSDKKVDFIVWPETSLADDLNSEILQTFVKENSANYKAKQLMGGIIKENNVSYVSAGLFDENGLKDTYKKVKLVPFGEFLPFDFILHNFYSSKNITSLTGTFKAGNNETKLLNLSSESGDIPFGATICFESLFPSIWRNQAKEGAQFFVNISNDGWFLESAAPYQHLRINVFRAVENRRPIMRSTTTGISAWIDSIGKIRFQTKLNTQETALFDFEYQTRNNKTFYTEYGDIFSYGCILLSLTLFIVSVAFLKDEYGN